jgi:hypothetical protein
MRQPIRIEGWAGQHDEMGARIVDADDKLVCTTADIYTFGNPAVRMSWTRYHENANTIVNSVNRCVEKRD